MLNPKVGDKVYNYGRLEEIIRIEPCGRMMKYHTVTKRGSLNFFTSADLCEHSINNKRIAPSNDKSAIQTLLRER